MTESTAVSWTDGQVRAMSRHGERLECKSYMGSEKSNTRKNCKKDNGSWLCEKLEGMQARKSKHDKQLKTHTQKNETQIENQRFLLFYSIHFTTMAGKHTHVKWTHHTQTYYNVDPCIQLRKLVWLHEHVHASSTCPGLTTPILTQEVELAKLFTLHEHKPCSLYECKHSLNWFNVTGLNRISSSVNRTVDSDGSETLEQWTMNMRYMLVWHKLVLCAFDSCSVV